MLNGRAALARSTALRFSRVALTKRFPAKGTSAKPGTYGVRRQDRCSSGHVVCKRVLGSGDIVSSNLPCSLSRLTVPRQTATCVFEVIGHLTKGERWGWERRERLVALELGFG
jgi:hypothetical protein